MPWRPHSNAVANALNPEAWGQCDRCDQTWLHRQLRWDRQWQGTTLQSRGFLVCPRCWDVPQRQLKTLILPPDPVPIMNARPEHYATEVPSFMSTIAGNNLTTMNGTNLTMMIDVTPLPDPNFPYIPPD